MQEGEAARVVQVEGAFNCDLQGNTQLVLSLALFLNLPDSLTVNPESAALTKQTPEQTETLLWEAVLCGPCTTRPACIYTPRIPPMVPVGRHPLSRKHLSPEYLLPTIGNGV